MVVPLDERPRSGPYAGLNANSAKRFLTAQFVQAGIDDADIEARILVLAATGLSHAELIMRGTEFLSQEAFETVSAYATRRLSGEPVDSILGVRGFYGRDFKITRDVLSPRADTEIVVAQGLKALAETDSPHILDLGTGSGAIIITVLAEIPNALGTALDISDSALRVARNNAHSHSVDGRLSLQKSDWFTALPADATFDLIISNPPYIDGPAMAALPKDVAQYDPEIALAGGEDGLACYRIIADNAADFLAPNGTLVLEIGYDQGDAVPDILRAAGFATITLHHDLGANPRCVVAKPR